MSWTLRGWIVLCLSLPLAAGPQDCGQTPPEECPRSPSPEDSVRKVVISHPYDSAGKASSQWELLELDLQGKLTRPGVTFQMGRATAGNVVFTPDGQVGIAAQEDGTLGVFRIEASGSVTVVHTAFEGRFYASAVAMDPSGVRAWVLDGNWPENGGGIYAVRIACDGTLYDEGLMASSKLAWGFELMPGGSQAVLGAASVEESALHADAHLVSLGDPTLLEDGTDAFGDDEAFVSAVAVTSDSQYALIADNNEFSGTGNRVAVVSLEPMAPVQVLTGLNDPVELVTSPFQDAALVVSGYGNALLRLGYTPSSNPPFVSRGALTYQGNKPQLPGDAVCIRRGTLVGLTLVVENLGVRRVQFAGAGAITDLGLYALGSDYTAIPGAIGVQP